MKYVIWGFHNIVDNYYYILMGSEALAVFNRSEKEEDPQKNYKQLP
jgi:hypothetical protein